MTLAHTSAAEYTAGTGPITVTVNLTGAEWLLVLAVENGNIATEITGCTMDGNAVAYADPNQDPFVGALGAEDATLHSFFTNAPTVTADTEIIVTQSGILRVKWGAAIWGTGTAASVDDANEFDHDNTTGDNSVTLTTSVTTLVYYLIQSGHGVVGGTENTGFTRLFDEDFGNQIASVGKSDSTVAAGSPNPGWSAAADEGRIIALAIRETAAANISFEVGQIPVGF